MVRNRLKILEIPWPLADVCRSLNSELESLPIIPGDRGLEPGSALRMPMAASRETEHWHLDAQSTDKKTWNSHLDCIVLIDQNAPHIGPNLWRPVDAYSMRHEQVHGSCSCH